jgi:hypothetical protein
MLLNGRELALLDGDRLPSLEGESVSAGEIKVAPGGCTFIII